MAEDDLWEGQLTGIEVAGRKLALRSMSAARYGLSRTAAPPQFPTQ
jgi:hypothetical protein